MPDIVDVLRKLQAAGLGGDIPLQEVPGQTPVRDSASGDFMEPRDIFHEGKHIATLDYNPRTGAWFLDTSELLKLSRVPNAASLILAEEAK